MFNYQMRTETSALSLHFRHYLKMKKNPKKTKTQTQTTQKHNGKTGNNTDLGLGFEWHSLVYYSKHMRSLRGSSMSQWRRGSQSKLFIYNSHKSIQTRSSMPASKGIMQHLKPHFCIMFYNSILHDIHIKISS